MKPSNLLTRKEIIQIIFSGLIGVITCVISTTLANIILVQISINKLFSIYFGFIFIIAGTIIYNRIRKLDIKIHSQKHKNYLYGFACLVIISGLICFCLERDWNRIMGYLSKIPLYLILGIALNFTLLYGIVDLLGFIIGFCQKYQSKPIIESPNQIICVLGLSSLLGFLEGLLFSTLDIEDMYNSYNQVSLLIFEQIMLIPFILVLGFIGGVLNEYLRIRGHQIKQYTFEQIEVDPFTEEI